MENLIVYIVSGDEDFNSDINYLSIENEDKEVIKELIKKAEKNNSVYTLKEFEYGINSEEINTFNNWVYICNKNVKI